MLELTKETLGIDQPPPLDSMDNLAEVLRQQGQVRGSQDVAMADATAEEGGMNNHLDAGIEDCI